MSELDMEALALKRKYPRCAGIIDQEVARIRLLNDGQTQSIDIRETLMELHTAVKKHPCAQKQKKKSSVQKQKKKSKPRVGPGRRGGRP
jgi:hypothetical protein